MLGKVPAIHKKRCAYCDKLFYTGRKDTLFCSEKHRYQQRYENLKFIMQDIPKSGVPGITFKRLYGGWEVRIKIEKEWKYIGVKKRLKDAIQFQREVLNGTT